MAEKNNEQFVFFNIMNETWGVPISEAQEILRLVEVAPVPDAPAFVEGVINLRGKIVFIVQLRKWLQLPPAELTLNTPILIIKSGELTLGLIADAIEKVAEVPEAWIESAPKELTFKEYIKAVIKIDGKIAFLLHCEKIMISESKNMLSNVSPQIYPDTIVTEEKNKVREILHRRAQELAKVNDEKDEGTKIRLIVFLLSNEWYGIEDIEAREVLRSARIYIVPKTPAYVNGVVNVRGDIIPVIDLAKLLGLSKEMKPPLVFGKILIGGRDNVNLGLIVDYIEDIIEIDQKALQQSVELFGEEAKFIKGKLELENKVIAVVNMAYLIGLPGNSVGSS